MIEVTIILHLSPPQLGGLTYADSTTDEGQYTLRECVYDYLKELIDDDSLAYEVDRIKPDDENSST